MKRLFGIILAIVWLGAGSAAVAQGQAGTVSSLKGSAVAQAPGGSARSLSEGSEILQNDTITTESDSSVSLVFLDETTFEIGEDAAIVIDQFVYQPGSVGGSFAANILKGGFKFVSGNVAKGGTNTMRVRTPVATIGVRGTSVTGSATASSAQIILLEPDDGRQTSIEVANQFGQVVIDEPGFGTDVPDASSPPSPPRRFEQNAINNILRSFRSVTPRLSVPRPRRP